MLRFTQRTRREMLQLLGVCGLPILAATPFVCLRHAEADTPLPADPKLLERWRRRHPEVAVVGNSMVYCRLNIQRLPDLWPGLRTLHLATGGTRSLQWMLWLKNHLAACTPVPKLVVIFYRDYDFNNVGEHISGAHLESIRRSMQPGDEAYLRLARGEQIETGVRAWLNHHFLATPANEHLHDKISDTALDTAAVLGPKSDVELQQSLEETFGLDRVRLEVTEAGAAFNDNLDLAAKQFQADRRVNYLPDFVDLANQAGTRLVFYRVKRRPNAENVTPQDEALTVYTRAFKAWVKAQGHEHVDENDDPAITLAMFRDGDHLLPTAYDAYTDLFRERLRAQLPTPFTFEEIAAARQRQGVTETPPARKP